MGIRIDRAFVARIGACVFAVTLLLPASLSAAAGGSGRTGAPIADVLVVPLVPAAEPAGPALELPEARVPAARAHRVFALGVQAAPLHRPTPPPEPLVTDGVVLASWYGPGFYGNRTACGLTYTPEIVGVAHRTLPCGTRLALTGPAGITLVVPVIDRGPYVAGRSLDLSSATRAALACSDLCRVHMTVLP